LLCLTVALLGLQNDAQAQEDNTLIVAIAGVGGPQGINPPVVDVIDGSDSGKTCAEVPDYPEEEYAHTAAFLNGRIYSCGGGNHPHDCYSLDTELVWQPSVPMPEGRYYAASSVINGLWWITGGDRESDRRDADTTFLFDGISFFEGPTLPVPKSGHCQVTINDTHVFFTGLVASEETYLFNWETEEWITLESNPHPYSNVPCGLLNNPDYGPEVIYAVSFHERTFIYNLANDAWREGPPFPQKLSMPSYARVEDGLITVGGSVEFTDYGVVYKFKEDTYEWEMLNQTLSWYRSSFASVTIPDDFVNCN